MEEKKKIFENRTIILELSVMIEDMLSLLLSFILEIPNRRGSLSLGTKNTGLSFNAKANLLLDMKYFEKENRWKFQMFMEIRNQFAHNLKVETFAQCFELIKGKEKLLKAFVGKGKSNSQEEQLKSSVVALGLEIIHLGQKVIQKYGEEYRREKILEVMSLATVALLNAFKNSSSSLTDKSNLEEFLLSLLESGPAELKKIKAMSTEDKNKMLKKFLPSEEIFDLVKPNCIGDYFSQEEMAKFDLNKVNSEINVTI